MEATMTLKLHYECPNCRQPLPLDFKDYALNRRQVCSSCSTPVQMTAEALERFSSELRQYCQC
jgi:hypothetical protein